MVAEVTKRFEERLVKLKGTGMIVRLDHAFSAFSGDIIGAICWEKQDRFLDDPDFSPDWSVQLSRARKEYILICIYSRYDLIHMIIRSLPLFTAFPILVR